MSEVVSISIHALLAESDSSSTVIVILRKNFYPRSPCGERRNESSEDANDSHFYPRSPCGERLLRRSADYNYHNISIHALLAESDGTKKLSIPVPAYFYPRSPCGERQYLVRGQRPNWGISIHALLAESDH